MPKISEAKVLIIATHGFEKSELEVPRDQLRAKGATVHVASLDGKNIRGWQGPDWKGEAEADRKISEVNAFDISWARAPSRAAGTGSTRRGELAARPIQRPSASGRSQA